MEIDDATLQRLRQLLAPDFARLRRPRLLESAKFPGNVGEGTVVRYAADASTEWDFAYDAASGYWKFVGGAPLSARATASFVSSATGAFQVATTPTITLPFAGDWRIEAQGLAGQATIASFIAFGPGIAGVGGFYDQNALAAAEVGGVHAVDVLTAATAGAAAQCLQYTADPTPAHTNTVNRLLLATPIRCR